MNTSLTALTDFLVPYYDPPIIGWRDPDQQLWFVTAHPSHTSAACGVTRPHQLTPLLYPCPSFDAAWALLHALWRRDRRVVHPHNGAIGWGLSGNATPQSSTFTHLTWVPADSLVTAIRAGQWLAGHAFYHPDQGWLVTRLSHAAWTHGVRWDATRTQTRGFLITSLTQEVSPS
ncbi:hypothetical protein [Sulfobacillus thermosulfidooxidans]|jgi:hypothetical protein|uniref:hypothetical protein n=1 Tax=Sulfobacillus thermosulfidooxidans TaxID=28034 RepID=UPI00031DF062|nr:hypothetical protein [Sulfobacillus thermosulfidooxidans]